MQLAPIYNVLHESSFPQSFTTDVMTAKKTRQVSFNDKKKLEMGLKLVTKLNSIFINILSRL